MNYLKNEKLSPQFQLKKYYPKIYLEISEQEYELFKDCMLQNIEKGIKQGLYREDIDLELTTKFYFSLAMSVHNSSLYTYKENSLNKLETNVLEYHTRAISTKKGIEILEKQLKKYEYGHNMWSSLINSI